MKSKKSKVAKTEVQKLVIKLSKVFEKELALFEKKLLKTKKQGK